MAEIIIAPMTDQRAEQRRGRLRSSFIAGLDHALEIATNEEKGYRAEGWSEMALAAANIAHLIRGRISEIEGDKPAVTRLDPSPVI